MAAPNISELLTTTMENRSRKLADNMLKNNAILDRLNRRGKVRKMVEGGATIRQELEYSENGTFTRYSGYDPLDVSPSEVFTSAEFLIKQAAVAVTISGLEQLQNRGREQMIPLLDSRIQNAEKTLMNNLSLDMYSNGTASGGKQMGGLQLLVADAPGTGTVGGINRLDWAFWRNTAVDISTDPWGLGVAFNSTTVQAYMNRMYLELSRGPDHPDLILADNNYYTTYLSSLQSMQRIVSKEGEGMAGRGFTNIAFMGADVVFDGGKGGGCPTDHMYFLNTDFIYYRPHADRNMVPIGGDRMNTNQDAIVKLIGWAGNMTLSNASLQGVLYA